MPTSLSLVAAFDELPDPRVDRGKEHRLADLLVIAVCTLRVGGESAYDMEDLGRSREAWLRTFLPLPNGIASHDTSDRLFQLLDLVVFAETFALWTQGLLAHLEREGVALDGKAAPATPSPTSASYHATPSTSSTKKNPSTAASTANSSTPPSTPITYAISSKSDAPALPPTVPTFWLDSRGQAERNFSRPFSIPPATHSISTPATGAARALVASEFRSAGRVWRRLVRDAGSARHCDNRLCRS